MWWRVRWRLLIGGGMDVFVCFIRGRVLGCGVFPRRYTLGVRLRAGLLVRLRFVDVVVIGVSACDLFGLLEACDILRISVFCCVSDGQVFPGCIFVECVVSRAFACDIVCVLWVVVCARCCAIDMW